MVSGRFQMTLWIFEGSNRSARAVHQSRVKELERDSVGRLLKVAPFLVVVVNVDTLHVGPAWTDANTALTYTAGTIRNYFHLVREVYSLPDRIRYLPGFKPKFLQPPSTSQDDLYQLMGAVCGESLAEEEAKAKTYAPPGRSDNPEPGSFTALARQVDRVIRIERAARSFKKKQTIPKSIYSSS